MTLHLYKDLELTQQISESDMSAPDTDIFDGVAGESKERELYLANEQATLVSPIGISDTVINLSAACFRDGDIVIADSEMMQVAGGGGTTSITVVRAQEAAAAHDAGAHIYTACNYTDLSVQPVDIQGSDESSWCTLALTQAELDARTPGDVLLLGNKGHSETLSFWRRITVPPGTPMHNKTDLKFRIFGIESRV